MGLSNPTRKLLYDGIRKAWVKATPEEQVRQQWLQRMVHDLGFPCELIAVEKEIKELPHLTAGDLPGRRVDILCYGKEGSSLFPLLLIECKAEHLLEGAVDQVIGYNHHIGARFIAVVGPKEARLGAFDSEKNSYRFCSFLPPFRELMQWAIR